jgi:EAL domain-containing protein (putative c-di-GMP-specific phosphodiesterase class I)
VIESIVQLGCSLGLSSVAEGVEDMDTFEYLRSAGCDAAQGYLISRPAPELDLMAWIQGNCVDGGWIDPSSHSAEPPT